MMNFYSIKKYLKTTFCSSNLVNRPLSKFKLLATATLLIGSQAALNAQVAATYSFQNDLEGWTSFGFDDFEQSSAESCDGTGSARGNVYYGETTYFTSPSLGTSNGGPVTVNFDYKVVNWSQLSPTPSESFGLFAEWSNNITGPWTTFYNLASSDHVPASSCVNKNLTFSPTEGNLYIRMGAVAGSGTDLFFYFDNFVFSQGAAPSCPLPANVSVSLSTVTSTSFSATWSAPANAPAQGYEYEIRNSGPAGSGPAGLAASGSTAAGVTTASVSTLTAATSYTFYVRSKCSDTDVSGWSPSQNILTSCVATSIPYSVPFEDTVVPALPACITRQNLNNDTQVWETASSVDGMTGIVMKYRYSDDLDANDWFYTAPLDLTAGENYKLTFKYKISEYEEKLKVAIGSNAVSTAMTTTLFDVTIPGSMMDVVTKIIDFTVPTSGIYNIGFQAHSDAYQNELYVGSISVENLTVACSAPTGIVATTITTNSAIINWTAVTGAIGYKYEVRTSGVAGSGAAGLVTAADATADSISTPITGLTHNTQYTMYVAAICAENQVSSWSTIAQFTTLCVIPQITADHLQTIMVNAMENATIADLQPSGPNVSWFAYYEDALVNELALPSSTQLVSGTTYFAVVTEDGCKTLPYYVTATVALGTVNQTMDSLSYYPNPVQNQLTISYSENITSITLFNLVGQKVMDVKPNITNVVLDMSTLSVGSYIIQVNSDQASRVFKLIKK